MAVVTRAVKVLAVFLLGAFVLAACVAGYRHDTALYDFRDDCIRDGLRAELLSGDGFGGFIEEVHCFDGNTPVRRFP